MAGIVLVLSGVSMLGWACACVGAVLVVWAVALAWLVVLWVLDVGGVVGV
jgi:hypothetical protein